MPDEQGGQGVPHVMDAGGVQLQLPDRLAPEDEPGAGAQAVLLDVVGDEVRPEGGGAAGARAGRAGAGDAEGERPFGVAGERGRVGVVGREHRDAAPGHEAGEGRDQRRLALIVAQVVETDVGDHGDLGAEAGEVAVALVDLGHEPLAVAPAGVALAQGGRRRPDQISGVEPRGAQEGGDHGRGGRLAVGPRDPDRAAERQQRRQQLLAVVDGAARRPRRPQLDVVGADGRRVDHKGGRLQVRGVVAPVHGNARGPQPAGAGVLPQVGAADGQALVVEDPRQGAHAVPADADEVIALPLALELERATRGQGGAPVLACTFVSASWLWCVRQGSVRPPSSSDRGPRGG